MPPLVLFLVPLLISRNDVYVFYEARQIKCIHYLWVSLYLMIRNILYNKQEQMNLILLGVSSQLNKWKFGWLSMDPFPPFYDFLLKENILKYLLWAETFCFLTPPSKKSAKIWLWPTFELWGHTLYIILFKNMHQYIYDH